MCLCGLGYEAAHQEEAPKGKSRRKCHDLPHNSQKTCKSHAKLQLMSAVSATLQPLAELWGPLNLCVHEQHTSDAIVTSTQIIGNPL